MGKAMKMAWVLFALCLLGAQADHEWRATPCVVTSSVTTGFLPWRACQPTLAGEMEGPGPARKLLGTTKSGARDGDDAALSEQIEVASGSVTSCPSSLQCQNGCAMVA